MVEIFKLKDFQKTAKETNVIEKNPFIIKTELKRLRKDFHNMGGFDKINKIMTSIRIRDISKSNLMEKRVLVQGFTNEELLGWITDHEEVEWGGKEAFFKAVADEILNRFSVLNT